MRTKPAPPLEQKRPRGRPRVSPHYPVATWLPGDTYDRLIRRAQQEDTTVSALVRRLVILQIKP